MKPSNFSLRNYLSSRLDVCPANVKPFTVIGGIRPVKDPTYLLSAFAGTVSANHLEIII